MAFFRGAQRKGATTMSTDKADPSKKDATISSADDLVKTSKSSDVELTEEGLKRVSGGQKVNVEYKPQKADGSLDAGIHFKYDIKGNKEG
jgi:type VI secretion system secreted protein Hcp